MPASEALRAAARAALEPVLFDIEPPQAIFDVAVTPEPESATIRFRTTRPAWATVELFRTVTGKVDLDMEKENRERIEVELFGAARTEHRVRFFDLPQERRFWFRISVPGAGQGTALGQKKVRHRGWFSTFRRTATCGIGSIKVLSDSDSDSAGDLSFEVGVYEAARGDALLDSATSGTFTVESGGRIRDPFGRTLDLGRAPDRVAVHVWGSDDDESLFVSFWAAPWEGLNVKGRLPPARRPPLRGPYSDRLEDSNDLEVVASLPVTVGRHQVRVAGMTPIGALAFEIDGAIDCTVRDVLGQPRPAAFGRLRTVAIAAEGRPAGLGGGKSGALFFAVDEDGTLLAREAGPRGGPWQELAGPPLRLLLALPRAGAAPLLLGVDVEGRLHLAALRESPPARPSWVPTGLVQAADARRAPALLDDREGTWLALRDPAGRLLRLALDEQGRSTCAEPEVLGEGIADDPVIGRDGAGRAWLAVRGRDGRVLAGPCATRELALVEGEVEAVLGIGAAEGTGAVLAALDREGRVLARSVPGGERWEAFGTFQEVVEPESLEPPPPEPASAG